MSAQDPYKAGMFKKNPYAKKTPIKARLCVILDEKLEQRGLELMTPPSRCVLQHEIHELILTDEIDAGPGRHVDRIAYLGFMEIEHGGVIVAGDQVRLGDQVIGEIAGFDPTHLPNHLNIVIRTTERKTGIEWNAQLREEIVVERVNRSEQYKES